MCSYLLLGIISLFVSVRAQYIVIIPNGADKCLVQNKPEKVKIQLFYECMCPDCRTFDRNQFLPTVRKLSNYLDISVYPYGNARTKICSNGKIKIKCQHGQAECYGNKLHACAINCLKNMIKAIEFNSCMMDYSQKKRGSNDDAADKCGKSMNIKTEPIKRCAKSMNGLLLLKKYGEISKAIGFKAVPHILINGVKNSGNNFLRDVCAAFTCPPRECKSKCK